jgi:formamidopyrimidine-DNA glycosylase
LFNCGSGHLLVHLGMSGSLRVTTDDAPVKLHDHVDIRFSNGITLRLHDPRRFGAVLWTESSPQEHKLLAGLGPEPLEDEFDADYLYRRARHRSSPVKAFIMDCKVVVGVGNIYANEALFLAGIHPARAAGRISLSRYQRLVDAIKSVLASAIEQGGTTLRDFVNGNGQPGYFSQQLSVYGRGSKPCLCCGAELVEMRLAQRSTVYCKSCQR